MTAIVLSRVDESRNMARFYKLDVQPTLFGEWSYVREWGKIGRAGRVSVEQYETRGLAEMVMISKWVRKLKRGKTASAFAGHRQSRRSASSSWTFASCS